MRRTSSARLSDTDSDSSMSEAFSDNEDDYRPIQSHNNNNNRSSSSSSQQFFAKLVRDTRSKVEQKTSEINANFQEKLPEWKQRGAMYSKQAKETSIEWSKKGKDAVDRWKRGEEENDNNNSQSHNENAIFGLPLELAVSLTRIRQDDSIPAVFKRCIEYLNVVGLHEVGIYRIPGSTTTVNKLRSVFDQGSDIDFMETRPDPHAVGTLLKMYLRELPEPIIPVELSNEYNQQFKQSILSSAREETDKRLMQETIDVTTSLTMTDSSKLPPMSPSLLKTVRCITSKLPIPNFCLLQLLFKHLRAVTENEKINRMSISNLALIFIPTLNMGRALFHCMIEHYIDLFETKQVPPPLPQKPKNLSIKKKIAHSKTYSDTDLILPVNKIPPPKPIRNKAAVKPRSKSVSVPPFKPSSHQPEEEDIIWKRSGRVEAIGKQFETLMNSKYF